VLVPVRVTEKFRSTAAHGFARRIIEHAQNLGFCEELSLLKVVGVGPVQQNDTDRQFNPGSLSTKAIRASNKTRSASIERLQGIPLGIRRPPAQETLAGVFDRCNGMAKMEAIRDVREMTFTASGS